MIAAMKLMQIAYSIIAGQNSSSINRQYSRECQDRSVSTEASFACSAKLSQSLLGLKPALPAHPPFYQHVHDARIGECACIAEITIIIGGDFAQDAAHDLTGPGLGQTG